MIDLENIRDFAIPDFQGFSAFGNAQHFNALPETHKEQVHFLNSEATKYLWSFTGVSAHLFTSGNWDPFAKGNFKTIEKFSHLCNDEADNQLLKKWLFNRGIPFKQWIFILSEDHDNAVLTTWKIFVKHCTHFLFSGDTVVFDHTLNWTLFYFHENELTFGKDKVYDDTENEAMMKALNERKQQFPQFRHPYL
ncbi:MAG TPA: hypothetical protein VLC98_02850 [Phnomibacter sp.]|nr:hypothetical protein [Phnomibacter sp.]